MDLFWTIVVILVILWALGFFAGIGPLINILIVIAVIIVVYRLLTGRHILSGQKR
ncbi:MAG: lmo0937 family membrane protein [Candidatus Bathyarchaeia archaeon]